MTADRQPYLPGNERLCETTGEGLATTVTSKAASKTVAMASFSTQVVAAKA
jgi:hypothetical protein